jgi:phosphate starvation-inducible PhoH-like protein
MATKKQVQPREELEQQDPHKHKHQPINNGLKIKLDHLKTFEPLTENQALFFDMYRGGGYFMGLFGSPGVGKTFLAMYKALEEVLSKDNSFKQIVVVRSVVPTRDVGFLPGTLEEKQEIYEMPYKEICQTLFGRPDAWDRLKEQGHARFISTTAIRGISIDDAIILVDESQNCTWGELSTVMGRVGHRSKIIFSGDKFQNDLTKKHDQSGLSTFLGVARSMSEYQEVIFSPDDIVRSSLVKNFIIACAKNDLLPAN